MSQNRRERRIEEGGRGGRGEERKRGDSRGDEERRGEKRGEEVEKG